ncbi:hypothetical protein ACFX2A_013674 [Malus domestica]
MGFLQPSGIASTAQTSIRSCRSNNEGKDITLVRITLSRQRTCWLTKARYSCRNMGISRPSLSPRSYALETI